VLISNCLLVEKRWVVLISKYELFVNRKKVVGVNISLAPLLLLVLESSWEGSNEGRKASLLISAYPTSDLLSFSGRFLGTKQETMVALSSFHKPKFFLTNSVVKNLCWKGKIVKFGTFIPPMWYSFKGFLSKNCTKVAIDVLSNFVD
jgi:hypothetical protein